MLKIRLYHLKTLLWTYLVWALLNLLSAFLSCIPREQIYGNTNHINYPWLLVPIIWAWLHIAPLWGLILTCWAGDTNMIIFLGVAMVVAGLSVAAGLLINKRWACFLVIVGLSIWFLAAQLALAMAV